MEIIINDEALNDNQISEIENKSRAILVAGNKILVCEYADLVLFPGGKVGAGEDYETALIRELAEETGVVYDINELREYLLVSHYEKNYPMVDGRIINRLVKTKYYVGMFKGLNLDNTNRTMREQNGKFNIRLVDMNELLDLLKRESNNPRKSFFIREILEALNDFNVRKFESNVESGVRS